VSIGEAAVFKSIVIAEVRRSQCQHILCMRRFHLNINAVVSRHSSSSRSTSHVVSCSESISISSSLTLHREVEGRWKVEEVQGQQVAYPKTNIMGKSEKIGKFQQASERRKMGETLKFSARSFEPHGRLGIRARPDLAESGPRSFRCAPIECKLRPFVKRHMLDCLCRRAQCNIHRARERHRGSCPHD